MANETEVPVLWMMQIREAAVDQRPDEVQRERRALVAAQQQGRIGLSGLLGELWAVDDIPAIGRQGHPITGLGVGGARLRILAGHATDADDGTFEAVDEHQAHLQQYLETLGDAARIAVLEALCAVSTLQQEPIPPLGGGELAKQSFDLPRDHDGRQSGELCHHSIECHAVTVVRLLSRRESLPGGGAPFA